jgi:hypothetical protein
VMLRQPPKLVNRKKIWSSFVFSTSLQWHLPVFAVSVSLKFHHVLTLFTKKSQKYPSSARSHQQISVRWLLDCNDGILCTEDVCLVNGTCSNTVRHDSEFRSLFFFQHLFLCKNSWFQCFWLSLSDCTDTNYCNIDICDQFLGCLHPDNCMFFSVSFYHFYWRVCGEYLAAKCDDIYDCTLDFCNTTAPQGEECVNQPRDVGEFLCLMSRFVFHILFLSLFRVYWGGKLWCWNMYRVRMSIRTRWWRFVSCWQRFSTRNFSGRLGSPTTIRRLTSTKGI